MHMAVFMPMQLVSPLLVVTPIAAFPARAHFTASFLGHIFPKSARGMVAAPATPRRPAAALALAAGLLLRLRAHGALRLVILGAV